MKLSFCSGSNHKNLVLCTKLSSRLTYILENAPLSLHMVTASDHEYTSISINRIFSMNPLNYYLNILSLDQSVEKWIVFLASLEGLQSGLRILGPSVGQQQHPVKPTGLGGNLVVYVVGHKV